MKTVTSGTLAGSIQALDSDSQGRWDEYVNASEEGTFFHLSGWARIIADEFGYRPYYLYCEQHGHITGVLPLVHFKNLLAGNALISTPFLVYGGPIGNDDVTVRALADTAVELARELGADYLELRNRAALPGDWVTKDLYASFCKPLAEEVEANLTAIPRKQRAMVRKGIKSELETSWDMDLTTFYDLFAESYRNLGTPVFARSLFDRIVDTFPGACMLTTVIKDVKPVSSVLSFRFQNEILPYYGGGSATARKWGANDFMYWAVMERAVQEGIGYFDFGRSKVGTGSYRFKQHWGFTPRLLPYQYKLIKSDKLPNLSPTNPLFELPIKTWRRLPLRVTRLIGPIIAKRVG